MQGSAKFLGRTETLPLVKVNESSSSQAMLQWYEMKKGDKMAGELLAAFELFPVGPNILTFYEFFLFR